jgi:cysteine desulfurase/selenocysteine lyase
MEHHANIVPWHFLRERCMGGRNWWVDVTPNGRLDPKSTGCHHPRTKLIAAYASVFPILSTIVDVKTICHGRAGGGCRDAD